MSGESSKEISEEAVEAVSTVDKEDFTALSDEEVSQLCNDYAAYTRLNLAEEHGQVGHHCHGWVYHLGHGWVDYQGNG